MSYTSNSNYLHLVATLLSSRFGHHAFHWIRVGGQCLIGRRAFELYEETP